MLHSFEFTDEQVRTILTWANVTEGEWSMDDQGDLDLIYVLAASVGEVPSSSTLRDWQGPWQQHQPMPPRWLHVEMYGRDLVDRHDS